MRKMMKAIAAVLAVSALMAGSAFAGEKFAVKDTLGTTTMFFVDELGKVSGKGGIETFDASGNNLFFAHPLYARIGLGTNAPNAGIWLKNSIANSIQVVSLFSGLTTNAGGGGFVLGHNNVSNAYAAAGDRLGYLLFASTAANGTTMRNGGGITGWAEGTFTDTSAPTYFKFETASTSTTSTARSERFRITSNGNILTGNLGGAATGNMAASAVDAFLHIPVITGPPSATPTTYTGHAPIAVDADASKLWIYVGGAWKSATLN